MSDKDKVLTRQDIILTEYLCSDRSDIDTHDTVQVLAYVVCNQVGCRTGVSCSKCGTDWDDPDRITFQSIQDHIDAKGFTVDFE